MRSSTDYVEFHARSAFPFLKELRCRRPWCSNRSLIQTFGPKNVYVELQRYRIREQEARNKAAAALSREFYLPVLTTNGVNMATVLEREVLDVLTTIRHPTSSNAAGLLLQHNANRQLGPAGNAGVEKEANGKGCHDGAQVLAGERLNCQFFYGESMGVNRFSDSL